MLERDLDAYLALAGFQLLLARLARHLSVLHAKVEGSLGAPVHHRHYHRELRSRKLFAYNHSVQIVRADD